VNKEDAIALLDAAADTDGASWIKGVGDRRKSVVFVDVIYYSIIGLETSFWKYKGKIYSEGKMLNNLCIRVGEGEL